MCDLTSGRELTTVSTHTPDEGLAFGTGADVAPLVALSPDGHLLATVGRDESIRMWDASTETQMWALTAQDTAPASAAPLRRDFFRAGFGPDGTELLLCSWGAAPIVVDVATGETVISPNVGSGCFQASADGSRVVLAEFDRIEVWDLSQRTRVAAASYAEIAFYQEEVAGTALSPDGRILGVIGGPARNIVFLRDSSTLASLDRLEHRMGILGVGFSPDGTRIATVSTDGAARVWDARSGELIFTSLDEPTDLDEAWFVGDGSKIALLYSDGRLLVHSIAFEDVIEIARDRLTRGFTDEECRTYLHVPRCPAG